MQDRFKFRCWDKISKKMRNVIAIGLKFYDDNSISYLILDSGKGNDYLQRKPNNRVLMQSTGLKDKYGKLIFEGDIIKEKWYSRDDERYRECLYSVEYCKEKMAYCFVEVENGFKNFFVDMEYIQDDYEVIGNIYENKELLGGEQ